MEDIVGKYSERICHQLASEGMITKEDIPLCAYNLQVFIERTIVFAFIFMISAFRGYLIEVVVFVISFASIRKYSGGYHCKSFLGCLFVSVITIVLSVPMVAFFKSYVFLYWGVLIVSSLIIIKTGSLGDPESDLTEEDRKMVRRFGRLLCTLMLSLALLTFNMYPMQHLSFYIGTGVIQVSIYLIITIILHKEDSHYEEIYEQSDS